MAEASIKPAVKKVVETIIEPAKLTLELTQKEAQVIFAAILSSNGNINYEIYKKFKSVGFDEYKSVKIGRLDMWSIEGKLDEYIITPKELQ